MFRRFYEYVRPSPAAKDTKNKGLELQKKLLSPKSTSDTNSPMEHEQPVGVTKIDDSSEDPDILQSMREFIEQARPVLQNRDKDLDLSKNVLRDYERFSARIKADKITHSNPSNDQNLIEDSGSHGNSQTITTDSSPISWDDLLQAYSNLRQLTGHNQELKQGYTPADQLAQEPPHQEHTSGEVSQEHGQIAGVTKIGDSCEIDASIFNPAKIQALSQRDLALIDLRGIKGFKYDVSRLQTTRLQDIPEQGSPIRDNLDNVTELISDALEDSYKYKTYLAFPKDYKCLLMHYHIFRVMQESGKITHQDLSKHIENAHHFLQELIIDNQEQIDYYTTIDQLDQLAHGPSPERASGKLSTGVTEKGNSYIIDASKFDLGTGDLSKLDPSREITYDTSNIDLTKFKYDFSSIKPEVIESMKGFITLAKKVLNGSYKHKVYNVYPTIYERVLNDYYRFELMSQIQKSDLSEKYLKLSIETANCFLTKLMEANTKVIKDSKGKNSDKIGKYNLDYPEANFLFSKNKNERDIAEEIGVARAYLDLFHKNGIKPHNEDEFRTFDLLAKEIVNTNIAAIPPERHQDFLQDIRSVNQHLREIAKDSAKTTSKDTTKNSAQERINEDDLNPFQLALKKAIVATQNYDHWAQKWIREYGRYFNLDEAWVKKNMERLGIKKKDIIESNEAFLASENVLRALSGGSVNNTVYDYPAEEALIIYEELAKANAKLKYMHNQLRDGIPVESLPKHINGRDVLPTPGDRLNCLIHSLIKVGNPELDWGMIEDMAIPIRDILVNEGLAKYNEMLDLKGKAGERLISILSDNKLIDTTRAVRVYLCTEDMRMQCYQMPLRKDIDPDPTKPPYALFLKVDDHFDAMSELKRDESIENANLGKKPETVDDVIDRMNTLADRIKTYRKNHQDDLEKALNEKGMKWEDYEHLCYIAETLSQLKSGPRKDVIIDTSKQAINFLESIDEAMPADLRALAQKEIAQQTETDSKI